MPKAAKKTITICASASHYKNVLEIEKILKKMGFAVKIPSTANRMKRSGNFEVTFYKTWYKNKKDYAKKTKFMQEHFGKVINSDAILVVNFEKNKIAGYIGGNVLMEMTLAFHYKKPIFIYNDITEDLGIKEEIFGLNPIFLKSNLNLIRKHI
jgi:diphthamide synthase subunit DPH2